jgi:hypothetical protein
VGIHGVDLRARPVVPKGGEGNIMAFHPVVRLPARSDLNLITIAKR